MLTAAKWEAGERRLSTTTGEICSTSSSSSRSSMRGETSTTASHWRRASRAMLASFCGRSEEHTSELQSRGHLVCRLLLEKKKKRQKRAKKHRKHSHNTD